MPSMRSHGGLHDNCSEALVKSVATEMIANGMRDAGYRRINLDDCWYRPILCSRGGGG